MWSAIFLLFWLAIGFSASWTVLHGFWKEGNDITAHDLWYGTLMVIMGPGSWIVIAIMLIATDTVVFKGKKQPENKK